MLLSLTIGLRLANDIITSIVRRRLAEWTLN